MIESNILGTAAGLQYQGVIDKSEGTSLPALSNGVIIGRFKRGYTGKVFTVTADSYKTVLGHDPSNPSYMAVADLFSRGVSEVSILRTGARGNNVINTEWVVNNIAEGSSCGKTLVQASRTKDNIEVFSDIEVTPTVQQVSDEIIAGNYGTEVNKAVLDINPDATDWVLDPANNRVKYTVPNPDNAQIQYSPASWGSGTWFNSPSAACNGSLADLQSSSSSGTYDGVLVITDGTTCRFNIFGNTKDHIYKLATRTNPDYDPEKTGIEKYIPIDIVAAKVISNAEACDTLSKDRLFNTVTSLAHSGFYNDLFEANIL